MSCFLMQGIQSSERLFPQVTELVRDEQELEPKTF